MNVEISDSNPTVTLEDVPEDMWLVVYQGQLCIREGRSKNMGLFTHYGEMLQETGPKTKVQLIKSIKVEI